MSNKGMGAGASVSERIKGIDDSTSQDHTEMVAVDADLYSLDVVQRTAHRFSGTHAVRLDRSDNKWLVTLSSRSAALRAVEVAGDFHTWLLDDALRARIAAETREIRLALINTALAGATTRKG